MVEFTNGRVVCQFFDNDVPDAFPDRDSAHRFMRERQMVEETVERYNFAMAEEDL
jgi:hypothetical protein